MKAINLMRLILHINPVRTSLMRMNISQVVRHISATPQQVSCTRGRNVGIGMIYSLDREKSTAGCRDFRSSFWRWGGDWAFQTWPKALLPCPAGRCSWLAWLRMSLSHLREDLCPGPKEAFSQQTPYTTKLLRTDPKPGGFLSEGGAAAGSWGLLGHFPAPHLPPHGTGTNWERLSFSPGRGALVQPLPQNRAPPFLALIDTGFVPDHGENEWNLWALSLRARFIGRKRILWSFFMYLLLRSK